VGPRVRRRHGKNTKRFAKRENKKKGNRERRRRNVELIHPESKKSAALEKKSPKLCGETVGFIQVEMI
jgi:hypothetical protein